MPTSAATPATADATTKAATARNRKAMESFRGMFVTSRRANRSWVVGGPPQASQGAIVLRYLQSRQSFLEKIPDSRPACPRLGPFFATRVSLDILRSIGEVLVKSPER